MIIGNDDIGKFLKKLFPQRSFFIYFLPNRKIWCINYDCDMKTRDARRLMSETMQEWPDLKFQFERIPF